MGKSRKKHSLEFKVAAVKQVVEQGRSVTEVADNLGVNRNMLSRWRTELAADGALAFRGNGKVRPTEEELRRLRRELATACQERDILKKALAYFAKNKS